MESKIKAKEQEFATAVKNSETLEYRIEQAVKGQDEQSVKRKRAAARLNFLMKELQEKASYAPLSNTLIHHKTSISTKAHFILQEKI